MKTSPLHGPDRYLVGRSRLVLRFFATGLAAVGAACAVFASLKTAFGRAGTDVLVFSPAFACATILLIAGSVSLHAAVQAVKMERQPELRRRLLLAFTCGTLFVGVQSYGLWALFPDERSAASASLGVTAFIAALTTLHGLHFVVALLFLAFVLNHAWVGRYDHEYHWGLTCCAWFWHLLGLAWMAILAVFAIAL